MTPLSLELARVVLGQLPLPGQAPSTTMPSDATNPGYFEFLENHSHIIYPVLGVMVLALLVVGILQAWRTQDLDGLAKAELKREVILELRRQMGGVSAEALSRTMGLDTFKLLKVLEEMQQDGVLTSHTNTQRLTVWRLKGVGPDTHGAVKQRKTASR